MVWGSERLAIIKNRLSRRQEQPNLESEGHEAIFFSLFYCDCAWKNDAHFSDSIRAKAYLGVIGEKSGCRPRNPKSTEYGT